ncbi:Fructosamine kinase-domain-containing protein [Lasiosphaeria ovina]|uniref:protein-ribulosamine 3-kinase n=1 Tax=Lasiosphaeria ovina TaxID=92902 RepID=A0AAE0KFY4_9PEZI|nr:Fructosamine kinase-domain-containing protein [Lasiosphaeria ovina]
MSPATNHDAALAADGLEIDVDRHGGETAPTEPVPKPQLGAAFELDDAVLAALPTPGSKLVAARHYARSLWGQTAKVTTELPDGTTEHYFLKTVRLGETGRVMITGEFASLQALHAVSPTLVPVPHAWGVCTSPSSHNNGPTHFLLTQFREVAAQPPPNADAFAALVAALHARSRSPTGKFGFHTTTCHGTLAQATARWEASWAVLFRAMLARMLDLDEPAWPPAWRRVAALVLDRVVPRLLGVLPADLKPCLVHGDLWDENTAVDAADGEPFVFDPGSCYAHNEYEIGDWYAARHRLSKAEYVESYKRYFPPTEPKEEWDDRNLLYSLRFDLGAAIMIPGCNLRQVVRRNMVILCQKFCPEVLAECGQLE